MMTLPQACAENWLTDWRALFAVCLKRYSVLTECRVKNREEEKDKFYKLFVSCSAPNTLLKTNMENDTRSYHSDGVRIICLSLWAPPFFSGIDMRGARRAYP